MQSIAEQTALHIGVTIEIVVYNDGSTDNSLQLLNHWREYFEQLGIQFIIVDSHVRKGVGAAKNGAVRRSCGEYLCFQDIDDVMKPERIRLQLNSAQTNHSAIIGSRISRVPANSTPRLVKWANELDHTLLKLQIHTSHGPTLLMPTWFCHRSVFDTVGGFNESGHGTPEDLIFFYAHLDAGGELIRVEEELLVYTYHEGAATFSVTRERIWQIQLQRLEAKVFPHWSNITVWNAGKAGRKFVRALKPANLKKVTAFCDVDQKKIGRHIQLYCPMKRRVIVTLPVLHFTEAKPPLIICVKLDMTNGDFERNLKSLNFLEGRDYILYN